MIINETRDSSDNSALDLQYSNSPKLQNAGTSYLSVLYLLVSLKELWIFFWKLQFKPVLLSLTVVPKTLRFFFLFGFSRQGFSVALLPVLELALVDQAGHELTEIPLPLPPECWD